MPWEPRAVGSGRLDAVAEGGGGAAAAVPSADLVCRAGEERALPRLRAPALFSRRWERFSCRLGGSVPVGHVRGAACEMGPVSADRIINN